MARHVARLGMSRILVAPKIRSRQISAVRTPARLEAAAARPFNVIDGNDLWHRNITLR